MALEDFTTWAKETWDESYFNPDATRFANTWKQFDREVVHLEEQILIIGVSALAALATFFIGGLGGLATFRALTEHYAVTKISSQNSESRKNASDETNETTNKVGEYVLKTGLGEDSKETRRLRLEELRVLFPKKSQKFEEQLDEFVSKFPVGDIGGLVQALNKSLPENRIEIFSHACNLGEGFKSILEFVRLVKVIRNKMDDNKNREDVNFSLCMDHVTSWAKGVEQANTIEQMLTLLSNVSAEKRERLANCAEMIAGQFSEKDRLYVMQSLDGFDKEGCDIVHLARITAPLLTDVKNVFLIPEVLQQIKLAEKTGEGEEVVTLVQPLIRLLNDSHAISRVLKSVIDFPPQAERETMSLEKVREERKVLLEGISEYLGGLKNADQIIRILQQIAELNPQERFDVVSCALPHTKGKIKLEDREYIIQILKEFGKEMKQVLPKDVEDKLNLMRQVPLMLARMGSEAEKKEFMDLINTIPGEQKFEILELLKDPLNTMADGRSMGELIYAFFLVAPEFREKAFDYIQPGNDLKINWKNIIKDLFSVKNQENEALRKATISHLTTMLQSIPDQASLAKLANAIWDERKLFRLLDEQELTQLAFRIKLLCETDDKSDPNTAFGVYRKLMKLSIEDTPVFTNNEWDIDGTKITLNQKIFEQREKDAIKVKFADLPKGVGGTTIQELFKAFEKRLNTLGPEKRQEVEQYILQQGEYDPDKGIGTGWKQLRANLDNDEIGGWAGISGSPDEIVPAVVLQLFSILNYIKNVTENDLVVEYKDEKGILQKKRKESPLTPQEEALFGISRTILNCGIGKRHGIGMAYYSLPTRFKLQASVCAYDADPLASPILNYLNPVIQEHISELFSANNELMKALTGFDNKGAVRDVHEIRYAKNIIGKRVGLSEEVVFDVYDRGGNTLHGWSLKEALEIYFKHVSPEGFIKKIISCVKRDVKGGIIDGDKIRDFLAGGDTLVDDRSFWDYAVKLDDNGDFEMDDECMPIPTGEDQGLKRKGAIELLAKTGYFTKDK